jgi:hypothetical protein
MATGIVNDSHIALHNRLKSFEMASPKRFVVLTGQLVPLWGTGC